MPSDTRSKTNLKPPQSTTSGTNSSPRISKLKGEKKGGAETSPTKPPTKPPAAVDTTSKNSERYVCSICQNTDSIRVARLHLETELLTDKLSKFDEIRNNLSDSASQIETLDLHIQHLLLDKKKFVDYQDRVSSIESTCNKISSDIAVLQACANSEKSSNQSNVNINENDLDKILSKIDHQLDSRLLSIEKIVDEISLVQKTEPINTKMPSSYAPAPAQRQKRSIIAQKDIDSERVTDIKHIKHYTPDFIDNSMSNELADFFEGLSSKFIPLKGRSVLSFGEPYPYPGSPEEKPEPIPDLIKKVITKIKHDYPDTEINSCLVNKYVGCSSYLPEHSDDESIIKPDSDIFTLTVGSECTITFRNGLLYDTVDISPINGSLYVMSKSSQNVWTHQIKENTNTNETFTRYSVTLRQVHHSNRSSTVILGDSNTKYLKFGDEKGSFGRRMPGKRVETFHIGDINPSVCCGYQNIIVHVGINDLRDRSPGRKDTDPAPSDIKGHFARLSDKLDIIQELCPNSSIIVSTVLPTKLHVLNHRASIFNRLLSEYVYENPKLRIISHYEFVSPDNVLKPEFCCYKNQNDVLHLGKQGIKLLAKSLKDSILPYRRRTDVRSYAGVTGASGNNDGRRHSLNPS